MKHTLLVYDSSRTHGRNIVSSILYASLEEEETVENSARGLFERRVVRFTHTPVPPTVFFDSHTVHGGAWRGFCLPFR